MTDLGSRIVYVDGVDFQHEMGETDATVWPSLNSILERTPCAKSSCGVVKCEIRGLEWVHPQDLHKDEEHLTDEQRIQLLEKHIAWYQQRIDSIQKIAARIRSERKEHEGDFEITSNCEGVKVDHVSEQRRVARWVSTGTAFYYDEDKHGGRRCDNETLEMFKQYCYERYKVKFEGHGYSAQDKG